MLEIHDVNKLIIDNWVAITEHAFTIDSKDITDFIKSNFFVFRLTARLRIQKTTGVTTLWSSEVPLELLSIPDVSLRWPHSH